MPSHGFSTHAHALGSPTHRERERGPGPKTDQTFICIEARLHTRTLFNSLYPGVGPLLPRRLPTQVGVGSVALSLSPSSSHSPARPRPPGGRCGVAGVGGGRKATRPAPSPAPLTPGARTAPQGSGAGEKGRLAWHSLSLSPLSPHCLAHARGGHPTNFGLSQRGLGLAHPARFPQHGGQAGAVAGPVELAQKRKRKKRG